MSIVETYKSDFKISIYDEDVIRGGKVHEALKNRGYNQRTFSSCDLFYESLKTELPHALLLYYQPLNLKFHEMIQKVRDMSHEVDIVVLAGHEFWPGIQNLLKSGLINDSWPWPLPDEQTLSLRLDQLIEKIIFKFIAEQRSKETALIVSGLEDLKEQKVHQTPVRLDFQDSFDFNGEKDTTETEVIHRLIEILKRNACQSEFVYLRNYPARSQLLVMGTSFSTEKHFRGHQVPFSITDFNRDRNQAQQRLGRNLKEIFSWEDFVVEPVEFAGDFYGFVVAFHFDSMAFLKKTLHYLSVHLRNIYLEKAKKQPEIDSRLEQGIKPGQFPLVLSSEVSRSRHLKSPVSLIICHLHSFSNQNQIMAKSLELIKTQLNSYDLISRLDQNKTGLILPHCSFKEAAIKAEKIRRQLVTQSLKTKNSELRLCFGVSEFPRLSADPEALFCDAQKACSQVLDAGKNKVCLYSADRNFQPEFQPEFQL